MTRSGGLALTGIRVLDFSQQLPAPFATFLLVQLGAEVIKIEPPTGDAARSIDPPMFETVNAGKQSVILDLKSPGARADLQRLAGACDVAVEGFRPGVADRLGCGYAQLRAWRPDIIYCSLSGYGSSGPYRDIPGHDLNYLGLVGGADSAPSGHIGVPFVDLGAGTTAALAIVAALRQRDATGEGCFLDLAMLDVATFWAGVKVAPEDGSEPTYGSFAARDDKRLSIALLEDKFWRNLCSCLDWSDWLEAPDLATHALRRARAAPIRARLTTTLRTRPRDEWLQALWAADVPAAPVHAWSEVGLDPQVDARGLVRAVPAEAGGPRWRPTSPLPTALVSKDLTPAPRLGADGNAGAREVAQSDRPVIT